MTLLALVVEALERAELRFAVIGAAVLPTLGVSRSTLDFDLLSTDPRCLQAQTWDLLGKSAVQTDIRHGDLSDPLLGVVRFTRLEEIAVDLVVGRSSWQTRAITRARALPTAGLTLPVVRGEDLILLKLFAGGPQDLWDVQQILHGPTRRELIAAVERDLGDLPEEARRLWQSVVAP